MISARINKYIIQQYKEYEIPISTVIEVSLITFLKLTNEEKIKFMSNNLPEKINKDDIKLLNGSWIDMLKKFLRDMELSNSFISSITKGTAIGAIVVIPGALSLIDKISNDK